MPLQMEACLKQKAKKLTFHNTIRSIDCLGTYIIFKGAAYSINCIQP